MAPLLKFARVETPRQLGKLLGVDHSQLYRHQKRGLSSKTADNLAVRLGVTPHSIWGTEEFERAEIKIDPRNREQEGCDREEDVI